MLLSSGRHLVLLEEDLGGGHINKDIEKSSYKYKRNKKLIA